MTATRLVQICFLATLIAGLTTTLWGHHSQSQFDTTKMITLEGTLTAVSWSNPHSFFFLSGKPMGDIEAPVQRWAIEGPSPRGMENYGWKREMATPGTKIIMTGSPRRDGKPDLLLLSITLNGKKVSFKPE